MNGVDCAVPGQLGCGVARSHLPWVLRWVDGYEVRAWTWEGAPPARDGGEASVRMWCGHNARQPQPKAKLANPDNSSHRYP